MKPTTEQPPAAPIPGTDSVRIAFFVPEAWRDALKKAAETQGVSMADLCRMVLRQYLRERYNGGERAALGEQP